MIDRIEKLLPKANGTPVRNMQILLDNLSPSTIIPDQDKYYVFVYKAKTKGIVYDMHPFVLVSTLHKWGFIGFNFHWNEHRRYSWPEVASNLYEIHDEELNSMEKYPIAKFVRSR
jgi:hypothetical protein